MTLPSYREREAAVRYAISLVEEQRRLLRDSLIRLDRRIAALRATADDLHGRALSSEETEP